MKEPLYIFVHIPKTGGTTINTHIFENFRKEENLYLQKGHLFYNLLKNEYEEYSDEEQIIDYLKKLKGKDKSRIKIIHGHNATKRIIEVFKDREIRLITIIRDPFSQRKSLYNQNIRTTKKKKEYYFDSRGFKTKQVYQRINKQFEEWVFLEKDLQFNFLFNQGFIKDPSDLKEFYFILLTEKLSKDILILSRILKFKRFLFKKNVSKKNYFKKENQEMNYKRFILENEKDYELYNIAKKLNKKINREFIKNDRLIFIKENLRRGILIIPSEINRITKSQLNKIKSLVK